MARQAIFCVVGVRAGGYRKTIGSFTSIDFAEAVARFAAIAAQYSAIEVVRDDDQTTLNLVASPDDVFP